MLRQTAIVLSALLVFVGVFLLVERTSSPFFQKCISETSADESEQRGKEGNGSISSVIIAYAQCSGRFLDGHGAGITALFTIILAVSTILLWVVTNKAAEAAKAAAEHIPIVEGAFAYVLLVEDLIRDQLDSIEKGQTAGGMPRIRIRLKNFGKTPAFIETFRARLVSAGCIKIQGPHVSIQPNTIIGAGAETPGYLSVEISLSATDATAIKNRSAAILLEGTLVYSDMWETEWTAPFDGRYDVETGSFRIDNYAQKKKNNA
jgi:hypothetical protein